MFNFPPYLRAELEETEPTLKDVMILLLSIDTTLDGIFDMMHERADDAAGICCGEIFEGDDEPPIPSMFNAVAFLDHEERLEKLEALLKKDQ